MLEILGTSNICMILSSIPCTTSNPAVLLHHTAAAWRSFLAWRSRVVSLKTTSDVSKIRIGSGWERFSRIVLRRPGSREVRTTWNSRVLGLAIFTACVPSSLRFSHSKFSSCEHYQTRFNRSLANWRLLDSPKSKAEPLPILLMPTLSSQRHLIC